MGHMVAGALGPGNPSHDLFALYNEADFPARLETGSILQAFPDIDGG